MKKNPDNDDRTLLLQLVEEAYRLPTWNGTNLRASLTRVSATVAAWKPAGGRRSIADITVHCAYWKYALRREIRDDKRGTFLMKGSNWFRLPPNLSPAQWAEYVGWLDEQHDELCQAIRQSPRSLHFRSPADQPLVRKIFGLAIHDAYHTGQVHLLKKQWKRQRSDERA